MSKSFIFDVDGTLVDSSDFHAKAWQRAFLLKGISAPMSRVKANIGKGSDQFLPVFLSKKEIEEFGDDLTELQARIFKHEYFPQVRPFPKVRKLFNAIRAEGGKVTLGSCSDRKDIEHYEALAQIADLVETCSSAEMPQKQSPSLLFLSAQSSALGTRQKGPS